MTLTSLPISNVVMCAAAAVALAVPLPAAAQASGNSAAPPEDYLTSLKTCREIADPTDRLACYDTKTGAMISAAEAGDVRIVDREELKQTRRQLFGFAVPEVGILKGDKEDEEAGKLFATTIRSARRQGKSAWLFTTAEGAVWEIGNPPARMAPIKGGEKVEFKKASLGYYFIRINGQMGVKGKRVQ